MHKNEYIRSFDPDQYIIKQISFLDIISLHKLYNSLSSDSKNFYNSTIYGYPKRPIWFAAQIALIASQTPIKHIIKNIIGKYVYYVVAAFNDKKDLIGFAHFVLHGKLSNMKFSARVGIAINDSYQGLGLGNKLMSKLVVLAKDEDVGVLFLEVLSSNAKAIRLYEKYGFEVCEILENEGCRNEKKSCAYSMILHLK